MSWSTVAIDMDIKEAVGAIMREYLVPELEAIKAGQLRADVEFSAINKRLDDVNKRLDDVNQHLVDQSRRIDAVREELSQRIDKTNERMDAMSNDLNSRMDAMSGDLNSRMDAMSSDLNSRMDAMSSDFNRRIDATDASLGRLYEVIVRREEHSAVVIKLNELEQDVRELKQRFAV